MNSLIVIKIGGHPAESRSFLHALSQDILEKTKQGCQILLVHGGGPCVSELQKKYGIVPQFKDGLRQTGVHEMTLVDMALSGTVNKTIVRILQSRNLNAWGVSGADAGIITAESSSGEPETNRTGRIKTINTRPLNLLLNNGYLPVIAPPARDDSDRGMNVNADHAAVSLSIAMKADSLVFFSDVEGVQDKNRTVIRELTLSDMNDKIKDQTIQGGMIPKIQGSMEASAAGVKQVHIAGYSNPGDLEKVLAGEKGTRILYAKEYSL